MFSRRATISNDGQPRLTVTVSVRASLETLADILASASLGDWIGGPPKPLTVQEAQRRIESEIRNRGMDGINFWEEREPEIAEKVGAWAYNETHRLFGGRFQKGAT